MNVAEPMEPAERGVAETVRMAAPHSISRRSRRRSGVETKQEARNKKKNKRARQPPFDNFRFYSHRLCLCEKKYKKKQNKNKRRPLSPGERRAWTKTTRAIDKESHRDRLVGENKNRNETSTNGILRRQFDPFGPSRRQLQTTRSC